MTDLLLSSDPSLSYDRYAAALKKAAALNKESLFPLLEAAGITSVIIEFDGSGDSGQIESVKGYKGEEEEVDLPDVSLTLYTVSWGDDEPKRKEDKLEAALETLCYDWLEVAGLDWYNDDGGYGRLEIHVQDQRMQLDCNIRYTESHNHHFEL